MNEGMKILIATQHPENFESIVAEGLDRGHSVTTIGGSFVKVIDAIRSRVFDTVILDGVFRHPGFNNDSFSITLVKEAKEFVISRIVVATGVPPVSETDFPSDILVVDLLCNDCRESVVDLFKKLESGELELDKMQRQAEKEVYLSIDLLAKNEGIEITEAELPVVTAHADIKSSSYFSPELNRVSIMKSGIGNGTHCFEEASHYLRWLILKRKGIPVEDHDPTVQEFFGFIGRTLGKQLTSGTENACLFQEVEDDDLNNSEIIERWDEIEREASNTIRDLEMRIKPFDEFCRLQEDLFSAIRKILRTELEKKPEDIHPDTCRKAIEDVIKDFAKNVNEFFNEIAFIKDAGECINKLMMVLASYQNVSKLSPEKRIEAVNRLGRDCIGISKFAPFVFNSVAEYIPLIRKINEIQAIITHKGYAFAYEYSFEELSQKGLYSMSDEEIRKRFFKAKPRE